MSARRVPEPAQRAADEVGAEACLEPDDARRQLGELGLEGKAFELLAQDDLALRIETDDVEDILADIDTNGGKGLCGLTGVARHGLLLLIEARKPFRLTRRSGEAAGPSH